MRNLTRLLFVTALALPTAQAATFYVEYTDALSLPEGILKLPLEVGMVKGSDRSKWEQVTKPYSAYMADTLMAYTGKPGTCGTTFFTGIFLPGKTETEFRSAEKALSKAFVTNSTNPIFKFKAYTLLKSYPMTKVSSRVTGSRYIYKSNPASGVNNHYLHGYFYDSELKQGVLMICPFIKSR